MKHIFVPTKEFNDIVRAVADSNAPDTLEIVPSKAVKLNIKATRNGVTLFEMKDVALSKIDSLQITDCYFKIAVEGK